MTKMYDYLITYGFNKEGYLTGCTGTMAVSRLKKITTFDDVAEVTHLIKDTVEGAANIGIYNIILLGRNKH